MRWTRGAVQASAPCSKFGGGVEWRVRPVHQSADEERVADTEPLF